MKKKLDLIDNKILAETPISEWVKDRPQSKDFFWFPVEGKTITSFEKIKPNLKKFITIASIVILLLTGSQLFFYFTSGLENVWYLWGAIMFALGGALLILLTCTFAYEETEERYKETLRKLNEANQTTFETWLETNNVRFDYHDRYRIYQQVLNQTYLYPQKETKTTFTTVEFKKVTLVKNANGSVSLNKPYVERKTTEATHFNYLNQQEIQKLNPEKARLYKERLRNRIDVLLSYDQSAENHYELESYADSLKQLKELDQEYSVLNDKKQAFKEDFANALSKISEAVEIIENGQVNKIGKKVSVLNNYLGAKRKQTL